MIFLCPSIRWNSLNRELEGNESDIDFKENRLQMKKRTHFILSYQQRIMLYETDLKMQKMAEQMGGILLLFKGRIEKTMKKKGFLHLI